MISIFNLLWIIPISMLTGFFATAVLCVMERRRNEAENEPEPDQQETDDEWDDFQIDPSVFEE